MLFSDDRLSPRGRQLAAFAKALLFFGMGILVWSEFPNGDQFALVGALAAACLLFLVRGIVLTLNPE